MRFTRHERLTLSRSSLVCGLPPDELVVFDVDGECVDYLSESCVVCYEKCDADNLRVGIVLAQSLVGRRLDGVTDERIDVRDQYRFAIVEKLVRCIDDRLDVLPGNDVVDGKQYVLLPDIRRSHPGRDRED